MNLFPLKLFRENSHALSTQHSALSTQQTYELRHARQGFTLIELSIVLVIIGLIIGGVLVGQDLIAAARVRAQITQIEQLETQITTFQLKYNCLPGDCRTATTFFGTTDAEGNTVSNGDGDRSILSTHGSYISGNCLSGSIGSEVTQLFLHLDLAGLANYGTDGTSGTKLGISYPTNKIAPNSGLMLTCTTTTFPMPPALVGGHNIYIGFSNNTNLTTRLIYTLGRISPPATPIQQYISPDSAHMLDSKIDDGVYNTGIVAIQSDCTGAAIPASNYGSLDSDCMVSMGKKLGW